MKSRASAAVLAIGLVLACQGAANIAWLTYNAVIAWSRTAGVLTTTEQLETLVFRLDYLGPVLLGVGQLAVGVPLLRRRWRAWIAASVLSSAGIVLGAALSAMYRARYGRVHWLIVLLVIVGLGSLGALFTSQVRRFFHEGRPHSSDVVPL
jgi:predicted exporter